MSAWNRFMSSWAAAPACAAAEADSWMNLLNGVADVAFVRLATVGSAMILPPERSLPKTLSMCSPSAPALDNRRGTAIRRSAGEGNNELTLVSADCCCSITSGVSCAWRLTVVNGKSQIIYLADVEHCYRRDKANGLFVQQQLRLGKGFVSACLGIALSSSGQRGSRNRGALNRNNHRQPH